MIWNTRTADNLNTGEILRNLISNGYLCDDTHPAVVVHDLGRLRARLGYIEEAFPDTTLHTLAVKANPLPPILRVAVERGFGLEVASSGEIGLAESVGCAPERIVFDSPAKTRAELIWAAQAGLTINLNSEAEWKRVEGLGGDFPLGLRVNPLVADFARKSATMVATPGSKFGVTLEQADRLLGSASRIGGLHVHVGSQVATEDDLVEAVRRVVKLAERHPQIRWLDIGGGLPVRYRAEDSGLDPKSYYRALKAASPSLEGYRLITEMGRAIQANCGFAASRVEYVTDGRAILHFGADLCLRECYQEDSWYHEFEVFDERGYPKQGERMSYDLFGPLCFSGDRLAKERRLPILEEGDIVVMHDVGGYALGMWSRYCSRYLPEILAWEESGFHSLRRRETREALVDFWNGEPA